MRRIAFDHLIGRKETSVGYFCHGQLLVIGFFCGNDRRIGHQRVVNSRIWHKVGLEFSQIDIQCAIETKRGSDGRHYLPDQTIEIHIRRSFNIQVYPTQIIDGLIVHQERTVCMFQSGMRGQYSVVRFDHCCRHSGRRINTKLQLRLLAVINSQALDEERRKSRTCSTTERMRKKESLETRALIRLQNINQSPWVD